MARYNAVNARAEDVANTPFQPYTGEFVAGITPTQQAGINATSQYAQSAQPYFATGAGLTMQGAQSVGPLSQGQIAYYQNPYTQYVAGATQAALQQQQGQQLSDQQSQAIRSGAFGGDRAGIQRAMLQGQQGLATAQAIAPIYQQGYQQAVQTAQGQQGVVAQDLARQMAAGQQIAGLGTGAQAAALQGAQAQLQAGTLEQQTKQAQDTAVYQQFLQQRGYPFQVAQFLANIAMGTGALSGSTQTTQAPAPFFSDKRLKHDAEKVGEMHDGTPIYRFKYNGSNQTQIGLMAQDVEKRHPEAVGQSQGYKTVDYEKATDEAAHKANGGGLVPNWMGGAVAQPGHYAVGGIADTDLAALLAQQQKSFGPFAQGGLYGGSAQGTPYGGQAGIVPAGNLHVPKLLTSNHPQAQKQSSTAGELYSNLKQIDSIASDLTGRGVFQRGREATGLQTPPTKPVEKQTATSSPPVTEELPRTEARGGLIPRGHFYSGGEPVIPGMEDRPEDPGSASGAMGDGISQVVKSGSAQTPRSLPEPGKPPQSSQQGSNPLGMVASGIGAAKGLGSIGSGIGSLASGLGIGAEAAGAAAGAAGAAGGIGSALGSIGSGIAQVLPFLGLALSDERMKHNKREVGKLYDGQPVYSYDFGDGRTQMGLMAQNVERRHPEAVAETDGGLKMVDYHRATEHAADKGHFYSGGLVPREHFDAGGPTDEITTPEQAAAAPHPADDIFERRVIPQESGGKQFDRYGKPLTSPAGAIGIAQVMPGTAPEAAKLAGLEFDENRYRNDPDYNKALGQAYFRAQYNRYNNPELAMAAYNAGPGNVEKALARARAGDGDWRSFLPAETQKYIGMSGPTRAGGVMTALKSAVEPITGAVQDTGNFISRNKDIIIPVLQGLGAMASSPSRYLGSAILQGLGAGAKGYADLQKQQQDIAESQGRTTVGLSGISPSALIGTINPQTGKMEYRIRPDYFGGRLAGDKSATEQKPQSGLEQIQKKIVETGEQAVSGQPAKSTPLSVDSSGGQYNFSLGPKEQTEADFRQTFGDKGYKDSADAPYVLPSLVSSQPAVAAKAAQDQTEAQKRVEQASGVPDRRRETNMMTDAVFGISPDGASGLGPKQSDRARALAMYDWAAKFAGLPGLSSAEQQNITSAQVIEKLRQQMGPMTAGQYGFHGQSLAQAINDAQISGSLTPEASLKLASSMYVQQQIPQDFARYYDSYVKKYGTALNVQQNFDREMGQRYEEEKKRMEQVLKPVERKMPNGTKYWTSWAMELRKNPAYAPKFDEEFKMPGLARMLIGG
jgi:hypothetical protein